ncbi:hypothetical protein [Parasitella parasitica]|uniref:Uncharacterized protein n=1 Tax=Parasitella parasitica TaxID=35722 RepID=A0A0B7NPZ2_9FUNG|nr:hypothetical protein [Parasitella parasitica]
MSDSDEEYGPIAATWGSQVPAKPDKPADWHSLVDPDVKIGPNNVGSGNLHRRGTNYKPIDEELILAHRKNIQVSKKTMMEAIRATELTLGLPESKEKPRKGKPKKKTADKFPQPKPQRLNTSYIPPSPPPSTTRLPPSATNGVSSSWLNSNLVDTPFWEKKTETAPDNNTTKKSNMKTASHNDWASAVKEVTSDPHDKRGNSPTEWMTPSKVGKPVSPENKKPTIPVTWASNNQVDNAANTGWGSVNNFEGHSENKRGFMRARKEPEEKKPPSVSSWGSFPSHPSDNDCAKSEWKSAASNWPTPAARETPAATLNDNKELMSNNWGATANVDWTTSSNTAATTTSTATSTAAASTATTIATSIDSIEGWGQQNRGWGVEMESANWGSTDTTNTTFTSNTATSNVRHIPSDKPSWLNSIPDKGSQSQSSRFSNPHKQRYSESPIDIPEPVNYRRDGKIVPLRTAPPPPPENSLVASINVELSDTIKVLQEIRELDDPHQIAVEFGTKNNISSPKVIEALTNLFTTQKELGLKKKNQRLQRRVQPKNYDNVYNQPFSPSKFSTFSRPSSAVPSPAPFARKVYY